LGNYVAGLALVVLNLGSARKRNWIVTIGLVAVLTTAGLAIAASVLAARIEPYARP
jgi:hypothetical protein